MGEAEGESERRAGDLRGGAVSEGVVEEEGREKGREGEGEEEGVAPRREGEPPP